MGLLSVCNGFKCRLVFATLLFCCLIYANVKSEELGDSAPGQLPFCDEELIDKRDYLNKRY